jgi:hypothetical protein
MSLGTDTTKTALTRLFRAFLDELTTEHVHAVCAEQHRHLDTEAALDTRLAEVEQRLAEIEARQAAGSPCKQVGGLPCQT